MPLPDWTNPPLTPGLFTSKLPDPGSILGSLPLPGSGIPPEWAQKAIQSATVLSGYLLQGVSLSHGWTDSFAPLDSLLSTAVKVAAAGKDADPLDILNAVVSLVQQSNLLRAVLQEPLEAVQDLILDALAGTLGMAASTVAEILPFVGWVVAIIKGSVLISRIIKENNERGFGKLPGALEGQLQGVVPSFNRARDDDAANALLKVFEGTDWTEVWMPSTAPWGRLALDYNGNGRIDGWFVGANVVSGLATDIEMPGGVWSAIPGIAQLGGAYYGLIIDGALDPRSISDVYPSVNQLAGMAWTYMQRPTGLCCAVDLKKVEHAWGIWQGRAREINETESMQGGGDVEKARLLVDAARGVTYHDYKILRTNLYPGSDGRRGSTKVVSERVRDACQDMRERIHRNLGTIACAYVPPEAPALRDVNLKLRYAAMRMKLLKHHARYEVELDLVPDKYYRDLLFQSRLKLAAPGVRPIGRRPLDGGPSPQPPRLPGVPGGGDGSGGDGTGWLVAGVLAAVLAGLALRKRAG